MKCPKELLKDLSINNLYKNNNLFLQNISSFYIQNREKELLPKDSIDGAFLLPHKDKALASLESNGTTGYFKLPFALFWKEYRENP